MMFFTDLDPRGAIKGSRDPLGLVPLWGRFGRHVVGNLTTATTSVRGFSTLMLGFYAHKMAVERGTATGTLLQTILRTEQLVGYCRVLHEKDGDIRGVDRIRKRLGNSTKVTLSAEPEHQILQDQKIYGLWGLYSEASRASGLLKEGTPVLTEEAENHVRNELLARLIRNGLRSEKELWELLSRPTSEVQLAGKHDTLCKAVGKSLATGKLSAKEKLFYRDRLLFGGPRDRTGGLQRQFVNSLESTGERGPFQRKTLRSVLALVEKELVAVSPSGEAAGDVAPALPMRLQRIEAMESLIAPAENAFHFLLARKNAQLANVAAEMGATWGEGIRLPLEELGSCKSEVESVYGTKVSGVRWVGIADALQAGAYDTALTLLVDHSESVMDDRGGAPWVTLKKGKVDVRFNDERASLRAAEDLPGLWEHSFFLDPVQTIARQLA